MTHGWGAPGKPACPFRALYMVVAPGDPGNAGGRWLVVSEGRWREHVRDGKARPMAATFPTLAAAERRRDMLNVPLYPPTVGPESVYAAEPSATPGERRSAEHYAALDQERRPAVFDRPSVRVPVTYAPFPASLPTEEAAPQAKDR